MLVRQKLIDDVKLPAPAAKAIRAYAMLRKRADQEDRRAAQLAHNKRLTKRAAV